MRCTQNRFLLTSYGVKHQRNMFIKVLKQTSFTDDASILTSSRDDRTRMINRASDVDADISSIDTDAPDLSDN